MMRSGSKSRSIRSRAGSMLPWVAAVLAASLVLAVAASAATTARRVLPFVQDDYAKALEQARARKLPLFIEAWAPW